MDYDELLSESTIEKLRGKGEPMLPSKPLRDLLTDRCVVLDIVHERPYTMIRVRTYFDGQEYIGCGFSKVKWPDIYNEDIGLSMALTHAVRGIVRRIKGIEKDFNHQR